MPEESARRIRSGVDTAIICRGTEGEFPAESKDLSLNGALIISEQKPQIGSLIEINIFLPGGRHEIPEIHTQAKVARHTDDGFAAQFENLDLESFQHLKTLVACQNDNPEEVLAEQEKHLGIK